MTLLAEVLRETAIGGTPARVADRLGVDEGLVDVMLDHAERIGLLRRPGCSACTGALAGPACAGCPIASRH